MVPNKDSCLLYTGPCARGNTILGCPILVMLSNATQENMGVLIEERATLVFDNKTIDGTAMKRLINRLIDHFGMTYTSHILDQVKTLGFQY